jgi:TPR repeat protein
MYSKGEGVAQSDTDAAGWYNYASGKNYSEAQFNLALLYYNGQVPG